MKSIRLFVYFALMAVSTLGVAAAPVIKVTKHITIDAPAAKVWEQTRNFSGLNTWHPAVATDKIVEGTDNTVGAVRLLTLKDGGTIKEQLLDWDDAKHTFRYKILEGVLPVSHYTSRFTVTPMGKDKTQVSWTGSFMRKNTGPSPGDNENDKTARDAISGVYQSGLDNLKKVVEGK